MARRSILLIVSAIALVLAVTAPSATAGHSWGSYHWPRTDASMPLRLQIGDNLTTTEWKGILQTANGDWNAGSSEWQDVLDNEVVLGRATKNCKAVSGTVQVCNAKYGQNGWLGLAQIWLSSGHIVQGVAKLNDTYFEMEEYNDPSEKRHVLCQEVGHTFGLGHTSEDGTSQNTCMDYWRNVDNDGISVAPNAHDFEQLALIYNHADPAGSTSSGPGKGNKAGNGRNVFVEQLANGQTLVTFIYWADRHPLHHRGH